MYPPAEFYSTSSDIIWRLKKAVYGLKTSPKAWQDFLTKTLKDLDFVRSQTEPNLYFHKTKEVVVLVYVDDLMFVGDLDEVNHTFDLLQKAVKLRPTGQLDLDGDEADFLGRRLQRSGNSILVAPLNGQVDKILADEGLDTANGVATPGLANLKITPELENFVSATEHSNFRRTVGRLM
jgi:hypothetical protein